MQTDGRIFLFCQYSWLEKRAHYALSCSLCLTSLRVHCDPSVSAWPPGDWISCACSRPDRKQHNLDGVSQAMLLIEMSFSQFVDQGTWDFYFQPSTICLGLQISHCFSHFTFSLCPTQIQSENHLAGRRLLPLLCLYGFFLKSHIRHSSCMYQWHDVDNTRTSSSTVTVFCFRVRIHPSSSSSPQGRWRTTLHVICTRYAWYLPVCPPKVQVFLAQVYWGESVFIDIVSIPVEIQR